jgi:hypothetical protein
VAWQLNFIYNMSSPQSILVPSLSSLCYWSSLLLFIYTCRQLIIQRRRKMARRAFLATAALLGATVSAQTYNATSTTTSFRSIFTVPAEADASVPLIPNINDPEAVNAQDVCPGYTATNVARTPYGLTADLSLAGTACNVYGTDVNFLSLTGEFLLHISTLCEFSLTRNS